jgi:hypothetical protein
VSDAPFAHEFALDYDGDAAALRDALLGKGYLAGVPVCEIDPEMPAGRMLFATTEKRTRAQMDALAGEVAAL